MLQGRSIPLRRRFVTPEGGLAKLSKLLPEEYDSSNNEDIKLVTAVGAALSMGWLLFEPFVLHGVGYDGDVAKGCEKTQTIIHHILQAL